MISLSATEAASATGAASNFQVNFTFSMSEKVVGARLQEQGAKGGVLAKLLAFAFALAIAPIGSYFVSLHYLFDGNTTYAAITAIVAANIVLVFYIVVSILEDLDSNKMAQVGKQFESRKSL